jgi:hypothetical protein
MKRLLRIFALLMAASMLIWIAGCGDDDDDDAEEPAAVLQSTTPAEGGSQPGNSAVVFMFDKPISTAAVAGATGTTAVQGIQVTFTPTAPYPSGSVTLTLTGTDAAGNDVTASVSYSATAVDEDPPELAGGDCDPEDGADGVDPADYPEVIEIAFNEALSEAKITGADPEFKSSDELSDDGTKLIVTFLQYSMPNEQEFNITVTATDLAGNEAELSYSFTTMAKEE